MRKSTRGRHVQHVTGLHTDMIYTKGPRRGEVIKSRQGGAIQHAPERPSPAMNVPIDAKFIHWKLTDGAKRRGWNTARA